MEDGAGGVDVVWGNDEIFHEIVVPEGESNGGVHETGGVSRKTALVGNVCGHFTERNHDKVTNKANKGISDKNTEGATSGAVGLGLAKGWSTGEGIPDETGARSDNETSSYCTSEGDHGNLEMKMKMDSLELQKGRLDGPAWH